MLKPKIKSFETIVKTFRKTITDLEALDADKQTKIQEIDIKIVKLSGESSDHKTEQEQSRNLKSNLLKLLGE